MKPSQSARSLQHCGVDSSVPAILVNSRQGNNQAHTILTPIETLFGMYICALPYGTYCTQDVFNNEAVRVASLFHFSNVIMSDIYAYVIVKAKYIEYAISIVG